jgi:hypothetical protein
VWTMKAILVAPKGTQTATIRVKSMREQISFGGLDRLSCVHGGRVLERRRVAYAASGDRISTDTGLRRRDTVSTTSCILTA